MIKKALFCAVLFSAVSVLLTGCSTTSSSESSDESSTGLSSDKVVKFAAKSALRQTPMAVFKAVK